MCFSHHHLYKLNNTVPVCAEVYETRQEHSILLPNPKLFGNRYGNRQVYKNAGRPDKAALICKLRKNIPLSRTVSLQALNRPTYLDFSNQ